MDSTKRVAMVATGMYLFEVFYSPGEGPVPFTYSAEAFPLNSREVGMSFATATTWAFNFVLSFTWPLLKVAFTPQGAFGWYAAWCAIGWVLVLLFVPETKCELSEGGGEERKEAPSTDVPAALTLEELDQVFSVPTTKHALYHVKNLIWNFRAHILRQKLDPMPELYEREDNLSERTI